MRAAVSAVEAAGAAAAAVEVVATLGEVACRFFGCLLREVLRLCVVLRGTPGKVPSENCRAEALAA